MNCSKPTTKTSFKKNKKSYFLNIKQQIKQTILMSHQIVY